MKNFKPILLISMAFLVACGGKTTPKENQQIIKTNQDYRGAEVAFVKEGKLYFYYPQKKAIKQFKEETETVFNCVFDTTTDWIYYTVERDSTLWLKKADYQNKNSVKISEIVNLKVKKEQCITQTYGEKAQLIFNRGECVILPYSFDWDYFSFRKTAVYSTAVGDVGDSSIEKKEIDYKDITYFYKFKELSDVPYKVVNNELIYKGVNLSNTLGLEVDEYTKEQGDSIVDFMNLKFSPDNSKILFGAMTGMGDLAHGPYCVANLDGTHQQLLVEDGLSSEFKPFWVGNQAVFLRYKQGVSDEEIVVIHQLCITKAENNAIAVIDEGVDYFTVRELQKSEQSAVTQSEQFQLDRQEIVTLAKPPFRATFAENDTQTETLSLQQLSVEKNDIIDDNEWFADNDLSMPRMKTEVNFYYSGVEAPLKVPDNIPQQWGDFKLIEGIKGDNAHFYLYGKSHMDYQHMLITDAKNERILHFLDFGNYIYSDKNNKGDFIDMRVRWADIVDNVLYVSTGHRTYAVDSKWINAFVTAIDLSNYKILWQSDNLVSNANNFKIIGENIVCGYGFTDEPDYLYVLDRFTGKKVQTLKLATGPEYIIQKGDKLYVRTYNRNYVFGIKKTFLPSKGAFRAYFSDSDNKKRTNIRNAPDGKVVYKVPIADRKYFSFKLVECKNKWFKIEGNLESAMPEEGVQDMILSRECWVHSSVIKAGLISSIDNPVLRRKPNKNGDIIDKIVRPQDIFVTFLNMKDDWVMVQYTDENEEIKQGWIPVDWICSNPLTTCP